MTWLKPRDKPKSQFIQKTFCHISYLSLVVKRSRSRSLGIYGVFSLLIKDLILYKIKIQFDKSHELFFPDSSFMLIVLTFLILS